MSVDPLDSFVKSAAPPVEISDERVHALTSAVQMLIVPPRPRHGILSRRQPPIPPALPRYALPMVTAALLGVLLGSTLQPRDEARQSLPLVSLISASTPSQPLGF